MSWLTSPESQSDPHYWAATAGGHAWIAAGLVINLCLWLSMHPMIAVLVVMAGYALWEITQAAIAYRRSGLSLFLVFDCIFDWCATAFGALTIAYLIDGDLKSSALTVGACLIAVGAGYFVRSRRR